MMSKNDMTKKMKTRKAMVVATKTSAKKRRRREACVGAVDVVAKKAEDDEDGGYYDIERWTSRHYDNEDGDEEEVERDLFDPDPRRNKNFVGMHSAEGEGAADDGVFLSLDVIPGDEYEVERTGDDVAGYVTRIVYKSAPSLSSSSPGVVDGKGPSPESAIEFTVADNGQCEKEEEGKGGRKAKKRIEGKEKNGETKAVKTERDGRDGSSSFADAATDVREEECDEEGFFGIEKKATTKKERRRLKREARKLLAREEGRKRRKTAESLPSSSSTPQSKAKDAERSVPSASSSSSSPSEEEIDCLRTAWSIAAPGVYLHPTLCSGLHSMGYGFPTPIQSATLPPAVMGRRDIVGAAPTGSGKTLSYGLPILQRLLEERDDEDRREEEEKGVGYDDGEGGEGRHGGSDDQVLRALIITPTRELAIQVSSELGRACQQAIGIGTIVGGFAEAKQRRILERDRPCVVVATPGRLWELMSSKEYTHLSNLSQLSFLVIDEADRMIKQGSFPQLQQIFEVIIDANPPPPDISDDEGGDDHDDVNDEDNRLRGIAGIRGEARVVMLDDSILAAIEREREGGGGDDRDKVGRDIPAAMEMDDDEYERQRRRLISDVEDDGANDGVVEEEERAVVHRQTFVYSATLTLPPSMHRLIKKDFAAKVKMRKGRGINKQPTTVDGAIAEILDTAGAQGEIKIVDLSKSGKKKDVDKRTKGAGSEKKSSVGGGEDGGPSSLVTRLPPGLTLGEIRCAQRHKDSHLYAYLVTTRQGSSGPCLVFCNSIAAVRRVGETLKTLGLPVRMLHAQMAQKSRLGALESLRTSSSRSIVVASDVAARGLDIQAVTTVVHYDVARFVDTFIHRAGRTARGVGAKAVGTSISLVAPAEEREHQKICEAVRGAGSRSLDQVQIDGRLLKEAQERVALATKIVSCNDVESQVNKTNKWLQDAAKEAGLDADEDMIEGGLLDGDQRDRQRFLDAKRAKAKLRQLLAKPMRIQHFGKFLSGAGLRESIKSESEVKPFVVKQSVTKGKQRGSKSRK